MLDSGLLLLLLDIVILISFSFGTAIAVGALAQRFAGPVVSPVLSMGGLFLGLVLAYWAIATTTALFSS